jgi:hypothetical protein
MIEVTREEFNEVMNEFRDVGEFLCDCEHSIGISKDGCWLVKYSKADNKYLCFDRAEEYVKNELRQPKATLVEESENGMYKEYELPEMFEGYDHVVRLKMFNGADNWYFIHDTDRHEERGLTPVGRFEQHRGTLQRLLDKFQFVDENQ